MLDLFKKELPETIEIDGSSYIIHTDYTYFIQFQRLLKNKAPAIEFLYMFPFEKPNDLIKGIEKIAEFMSPKELLPRSDGESPAKQVIDYDLDSDFLYAAFLEQYQIDLLDPKTKLHWYKFCALLKSLHDVKLCEIIGYRSYSQSKDDYNKSMLRLQAAWDLPTPADKKADKDLEYFNSLFEK